MKKNSGQTQACGVPNDVAAIRTAIKEFLDRKEDGRVIGKSKYGVYAFYDYDGEPIYVGQTQESLRQRIGRHLTNQRTDAVAMNVLDPFEVAEIEVWPLFELQTVKKKARNKITPEYIDAIARLNSAEYTVFQNVMKR